MGAMKSDYWEESGQVFVHYGKKYGVTSSGRTICIGPVNDCQKEKVAFNESCQAVTEPCQVTQVSAPVSGDTCYKLPEAVKHQGKLVTPSMTNKIRALIGQGLSTRAIAKQVGVSNVTVHRIMQRQLVPSASGG